MQKHILDYLTDIVKVKPDKLAFSNGEEGLTFREVYDQSRAVGTFLAEKGAYNQPVVVFMNKHPKEVTAFFGVITGGNYYVPIDEEMPASRIQLILDNVQSPVMICDEKTAEKANSFDFSGSPIHIVYRQRLNCFFITLTRSFDKLITILYFLSALLLCQNIFGKGHHYCALIG